MNFKFYLVSDLHNHKFDIDISDSLRDDTIAILVMDDIWYIEFLDNGDIFIVDGWEGQYAKNIVEAIAILKIVAIDLAI